MAAKIDLLINLIHLGKTESLFYKQLMEDTNRYLKSMNVDPEYLNFLVSDVKNNYAIYYNNNSKFVSGHLCTYGVNNVFMDGIWTGKLPKGINGVNFNDMTYLKRNKPILQFVSSSEIIDKSNIKFIDINNSHYSKYSGIIEFITEKQLEYNKVMIREKLLADKYTINYFDHNLYKYFKKTYSLDLYSALDSHLNNYSQFMTSDSIKRFEESKDLLKKIFKK